MLSEKYKYQNKQTLYTLGVYCNALYIVHSYVYIPTIGTRSQQ